MYRAMRILEIKQDNNYAIALDCWEDANAVDLSELTVVRVTGWNKKDWCIRQEISRFNKQVRRMRETRDCQNHPERENNKLRYLKEMPHRRRRRRRHLTTCNKMMRKTFDDENIVNWGLIGSA